MKVMKGRVVWGVTAYVSDERKGAGRKGTNYKVLKKFVSSTEQT